MLAMVGAGIYKSVPKACKAIVGVDKVQKPIKENSEVYDKYFALYDKIYPAVKNELAELAKL